MNSAKLSTAYFPSVLWTAVAVQSTDVRLEAHEHYQKQSYRNRCHILGPNGLQKLTFPVQKGAKEIDRVGVSYQEPWVHDHLKALETAYRNAPFFEVLFPDIQALLTTKYPTLWSLNRASISLYEQWLEQPLVHGETPEFVPYAAPGAPGELVKTRGDIDGRALHPKAEHEAVFPEYPQVFSDKHNFHGNLSALDLFFNLGRTAWDYLAALRF